MVDIFKEVDEDLRKERYSALWQKYGWVVIALAVLIVVLTAGYRGYDYFKTKQIAEAGAKLVGAEQLIAQDKMGEAKAVLQNLAQEGAGNYDALAALRLAGLPDETATVEQQIAAFKALAARDDLPKAARDLVAVRAGYLMVDSVPLAEVEALVGPLNSEESAYRNAAREILALSAYKAGNRELALELLSQITVEPTAARSLKARAQAYIDVISGHEGTSLAAEGGNK